MNLILKNFLRFKAFLRDVSKTLHSTSSPDVFDMNKTRKKMNQYWNSLQMFTLGPNNRFDTVLGLTGAEKFKDVDDEYGISGLRGVCGERYTLKVKILKYMVYFLLTFDHTCRSVCPPLINFAKLSLSPS